MSMKRGCALLLAALLAFAALVGTAVAVDLTQPCSLTVLPGGGSEFAEDLKDAKLVYDLYLVAAAVSNEEDEGITFRMLEPFTDLKVPEAEDSDAWQALAQEAAALALEKGGAVVSAAPLNEPVRKTDGGNDLMPGLYLLLARGEEMEDYVRRTEDEEGKIQISTTACTKMYEYSFLPELVSLPGKNSDPEGESWNYDLSVSLKPSRELRVAPVEISKALLSFRGPDPALFVFDVTAVLDGEIVYSDVVAVSFDGPGLKRLPVGDLPVGAEVTVTEVYSGARYTVISGASQTIVVSAEDENTVVFENQYNDSVRQGGGIVNSFIYTEENSWSWQQLQDNSQGGARG